MTNAKNNIAKSTNQHANIDKQNRSEVQGSDRRKDGDDFNNKNTGLFAILAAISGLLSAAPAVVPALSAVFPLAGSQLAQLGFFMTCGILWVTIKGK